MVLVTSRNKEKAKERNYFLLINAYLYSLNG